MIDIFGMKGDQFAMQGGLLARVLPASHTLQSGVQVYGSGHKAAGSGWVTDGVFRRYDSRRSSIELTRRGASTVAIQHFGPEGRHRHYTAGTSKRHDGNR